MGMTYLWQKMLPWRPARASHSRLTGRRREAGGGLCWRKDKGTGRRGRGEVDGVSIPVRSAWSAHPRQRDLSAGRPNACCR